MKDDQPLAGRPPHRTAASQLLLIACHATSVFENAVNTRMDLSAILIIASCNNDTCNRT